MHHREHSRSRGSFAEYNVVLRTSSVPLYQRQLSLSVDLVEKIIIKKILHSSNIFIIQKKTISYSMKKNIHFIQSSITNDTNEILQVQ